MTRLVSFVQGLRGQRCVLQTKNGIELNGRVLNTDALMNVYLGEVCVSAHGAQRFHELLVLRGSQLKGIQLDDDFNPNLQLAKLRK